MRILMLQRFDLSSVSCARRILCQAEELLKLGHEVYLADFPNLLRQSEIPSLKNLSNLGANVFKLSRSPKKFFDNIKTIQSLPQPDIIHLWKSYPDASLLALRFRHIWNIPLHYDWDDWEKGIAQELTGSKMAGWVAWQWDKFMPHLSTTMSAASHFLKEQAISYGFPEERIWDAPVGAQLDKFSPQDFDNALFEQLNLKKPLLIYSGQLEVATYVEQAILVLKELRKDYDTAKLLVIGGGRKLEQFKKFAFEQNLSRHVVFTDYIPADDVPKYLTLADVALAPFARNNVTKAKSPLKIAEYLSMGLPIISSDIGEAPRMTIGAGVCAPCGDIEAMAEKARWILKNPGVKKSMQLAGRKNAETTYNWTAHTHTLLDAYQLAMQLHHKQGSFD